MVLVGFCRSSEERYVFQYIFLIISPDVLKAALANTAALIRHALPKRIKDLSGDRTLYQLPPSSVIGFNVYENTPQIRLSKSDSNLKSAANSSETSESSRSSKSSAHSSAGKRFKKISKLFRKRTSESNDSSNNDSSAFDQAPIEEEENDGEDAEGLDTSSLNNAGQVDMSTSLSAPPEHARASSLRIFTTLKK